MSVRLLQLGMERWEDIDGYGVGHGFDPLDLPVSRFCNFVWWLLTHQADSKDIQKFRNQLWRPPSTREIVEHEKSPWSAENEMKAFASLKQALSGKANSG